MLAELDELKAALGIDPAETNVLRETQLQSSLEMANALIAGYIGFDLSDTVTEYSFSTVLNDGAGYIKLPVFPILEVLGVSSDGNALSLDQFRLRAEVGILDFLNGPYCSGSYGASFSVPYRAGFEEIPAELKMVALNIASAIYNMGGTFAGAAVTSGAGALKSLTMFDAMSMSFDTGVSGTADSTTTPVGMLKTWAFILNKYQVKQVSMA